MSLKATTRSTSQVPKIPLGERKLVRQHKRPSAVALREGAMSVKITENGVALDRFFVHFQVYSTDFTHDDFVMIDDVVNNTFDIIIVERAKRGSST